LGRNGALHYVGIIRTFAGGFSGDSPGMEVIGNGRGANKIAGKFVVWELEVKGNEVTRLAIDFIQHSEETKPPLYSMIRVNSSFH
jgi:hypothetical protein